MRGYRVFNDVGKVRVVWKLAGMQLGALSQMAMLLLMAISVVLIRATGLIPAAVVFAAGFLVIASYSKLLSQVNSTGALSELTTLRLLRRGLFHQHSANFDFPGL